MGLAHNQSEKKRWLQCLVFRVTENSLGLHSTDLVTKPELIIAYDLHLDSVQKDLDFLLDVATSYRDALKPYTETVTSPIVETTDFKDDKSTYFLCGRPFGRSLYLGVDAGTVSAALQALEKMKATANALSQKYGEKLDKLSYSVWGW